MHEETVTSSTSLVVDLRTGIVHCVPHHVVLDRVGSRVINSAEQGCNTVVKVGDLLTDEVLLISDADLASCVVPQAELGNMIRKFGVRGIRTPYLTRPEYTDPSYVPLYGNLTDPLWAIILLGGSCNSHCLFCYTHWLRKLPDLHTNDVEKIIDRLAEIDTLQHLVFSGGEATIRHDLVALFQYATRAGFPDIGLYTNGRTLKSLPLATELTQVGLKSVLLSLHGHNEEIHDGITGDRGSFGEALECLHNLNSLSVATTVNVVMCQENYRYLVDIVRLLDVHLHGWGKLRFSYPIVEGAAYENSGRVLVSFSALKLPLKDAVELAEDCGFEVQITNVPLCITDQNHRNTGYDTTSLTQFVEASAFYKFNIPRGEKSVKLPSCLNCSERLLCRGIQVEYLRAFPESSGQFEPIS